MKRHKMMIYPGIAASALLMFCITTGCKKYYPGIKSEGEMSASVAGENFQSIFTTGTYALSENLIRIDGMQFAPGDTTELTVYFRNNVQLNQPTALGLLYLVEYRDWKTFSYYVGGLYSTGEVGHGVITVTAWDSARQTTAGTFSGVLHNLNGNDSVVVANGQFSGSYGKIP